MEPITKIFHLNTIINFCPNRWEGLILHWPNAGWRPFSDVDTCFLGVKRSTSTRQVCKELDSISTKLPVPLCRCANRAQPNVKYYPNTQCGWSTYLNLGSLGGKCREIHQTFSVWDVVTYCLKFTYIIYPSSLNHFIFSQCIATYPPTQKKHNNSPTSKRLLSEHTLEETKVHFR